MGKKHATTRPLTSPQAQISHHAAAGDGRGKRGQGISLLVIVILGFLAYSNTLHAPFQWDESDYLVGNPFIRNLDFFVHPSRAEKLLDNAIISRYVGYLTFALNYRINGLDVFGYHVVNLAIHLANALLVYFLVALTFRTPYFSKEYAVGSHGSGGEHMQKLGAYSLLSTSYFRFIPFVVALLFVVHPVQTEAVTYVFQRFASLVSLFYLLSLVLYIKARLKEHGAEGRAQSVKIEFVSF